jgi:hypothetical protein
LPIGVASVRASPPPSDGSGPAPAEALDEDGAPELLWLDAPTRAAELAPVEELAIAPLEIGSPDCSSDPPLELLSEEEAPGSSALGPFDEALLDPEATALKVAFEFGVLLAKLSPPLSASVA